MAQNRKQTQKKKPHKRDKQKILMAILAGLMVALLVVPMLLSAVGGALAASESGLRGEISQLQKDAAETKKKKADLQSQLKEIASDKADAKAKKKLLDQQLAYIDQEISNTEQQIAYYGDLIVQEEGNLAAAKEKEAAQYELFCKRVRSMEETGTTSYLSILFNAGSFSEMLDNLVIVQDIMDYDNAVIEQLKAARKQVKDTLDSLNAAQDEQDAKKAELDGQRTEQAEKVSEAAQVVKDVENLESTYRAYVAEIEADEKKVAAAIAAKEKQLEELIRQNQITFDPGTGYYWPLPGRYAISSVYGSRMHPIWHVVRNHKGVDIPAPKNTQIKAARGGVITISAYDSSYGNYVVISHGNGDSTLYAHMNSRGVKEGDIVSQGQTIGYVGSTGDSTGPHLHFEVRVGGSRVDPQGKYPSISFRYV